MLLRQVVRCNPPKVDDPAVGLSHTWEKGNEERRRMHGDDDAHQVSLDLRISEPSDLRGGFSISRAGRTLPHYLPQESAPRADVLR